MCCQGEMNDTGLMRKLEELVSEYGYYINECVNEGACIQLVLNRMSDSKDGTEESAEIFEEELKDYVRVNIQEIDDSTIIML